MGWHCLVLFLALSLDQVESHDTDIHLSPIVKEPIQANLPLRSPGDEDGSRMSRVRRQSLLVVDFALSSWEPDSWNQVEHASDDDEPQRLAVFDPTPATVARNKVRLRIPLDHHHPHNLQQTSVSLQHTTKSLTKTGTTIAGVLGRDFVVLGADTRATANSLVADKEADKLHALADHIYAAGAGTSADLDAITRQTKYTLKLWHEYETNIGNHDTKPHQISVLRACRYLQDALYEQQGQCQANLIVGGFDNTQPILRVVHPHGSVDVVAYAALGSGGLAAMAVLEARYQPNWTLEEAMAAVTDAIRAGIENDLGSGSQIDLCVILPDAVTHTRAYVPEEELARHQPDGVRDEIAQQSASLPGVNGFGNVPYAIQSVRQVLVSSKNEIDELLGL